MSYVTRSKFNVVFPVGNIMSNMNFNNTSVVSWQSDLFNLLMEEIEYRGKTTSSQADFPKLAEKLSVIRTDRHEDLVRPKNILPVRKKSPIKFSHVHNV